MCAKRKAGSISNRHSVVTYSTQPLVIDRIPQLAEGWIVVQRCFLFVLLRQISIKDDVFLDITICEYWPIFRTWVIRCSITRKVCPRVAYLLRECPLLLIEVGVVAFT